MGRDILFRQEDFIFSYRVAGVLIRDGKMLLQKPVDDDYALIGGHVSAFESSQQALVREFREEIHAAIKVGRLMAVGEIFFHWGKHPCHQVSLYYEIELAHEAQIPLEGSFKGWHEDGSIRSEIDFCWVPVENLPECKVYPLELMPHILSGEKGVFHFVSKDI